MIVEGLVRFDFEITLLTISAVDGVHFCEPIGHRQEDGDYRESWQPQRMSATALSRAQAIAEKVVKALGGFGLVRRGAVRLRRRRDLQRSVSAAHDTGMVTLISQDLSEFALHVRAFLGLPIGAIRQFGPSASAVILPQLTSSDVRFSSLENALRGHNQLRLFGKPEIAGQRRLGVALATASTTELAVEQAKQAAAAVAVNG